MKRLIYRALSCSCRECKEVRVLFWRRRCDFCDAGEGAVK